MKRFSLFFIIIFLFILLSLSIYKYHRWNYLWSLDEPIEAYPVNHLIDDTIRVVMIGDSWVGMRTDSMNNLFQSRLSEIIKRPVSLRTSGKGGERTKGIYRLLFETGKYGLKPLFINGVDYCVIFAGINDAAANIGTEQYCYYYCQIINFLLDCNIHPVIIEIPNVDIWHIYSEKHFKDYVSDYAKSLMTGCKMYSYKEYRENLLKMLNELRLMDDVLFVKMDAWNCRSPEIDISIFLEDKIHLNLLGYKKLDESIAKVIAKDLE